MGVDRRKEMKERLKYISNNMKSYRVKVGLTQDSIAKLLGISRATYNDYETNPQTVKIETYRKIADVLNCNLVDFFMENGVTNSDNK